MKITLSLSVITLFFVLVGCKTNEQKDNQNQEKITIIHSSGTVEVGKNPHKVVALDYASIENLEELGIDIVAMPKSNLPYHLSKYNTNEKVVDLGTIFEVDFDNLKALNPDVIFISSRMQKKYTELSKIAPTLYLKLDKSNFLESFKTNMNVYSDIFDKKAETDEIAKNIESKIETLQKKAAASRKTALVILHSDGDFRAFGKGTGFGIIHDVFGFKAAVEDLEIARKGQLVTSEFILNANPDYLFIIDRTAAVSQKPTNKAQIESEIIRQTNAYKKGKIIYLDPEIWYLSGNGITSLNKMIEGVLSAI